MRRAQYHSIDEEKTTITFMTRGLRTRPSFLNIVPTLLVQKPITIRDLKNTLAVLETLAPQTKQPPRQQYPQPADRNKWCEFHKMYGNHATNQCRALQAYEGQEQSQPIK